MKLARAGITGKTMAAVSWAEGKREGEEVGCGGEKEKEEGSMLLLLGKRKSNLDCLFLPPCFVKRGRGGCGTEFYFYSAGKDRNRTCLAARFHF